MNNGGIHYRVLHTTLYEYSEPVVLCQNLAHLTPRQTPEQECLETDLAINPEPAVLSHRLDYFGNPAIFFGVQAPHRKMLVAATHEVSVRPRPAPDRGATPPWDEVRDRLAADRSPAFLEAYQFAFDSPHVHAGPELADYAASSFRPQRPLLEAVLDLAGRIHADFVYDPRATTVATPLPEVLAQRRGVCQDFAQLQIACLRSLGLAARYVSGFLNTHPLPGCPRLLGADATHAWLSVYCPGHGWVDVDPTNNQMPSDQHILLAWGRDYDDVSPIKGVILGGGKHSVKVAVEVVRLGESAEPFRGLD